MKIGDKVKVTGCRDGWSDKFVGRTGMIVEVISGDSDGGRMVLLDGREKPNVFFPTELTVIEEASTTHE